MEGYCDYRPPKEEPEPKLAATDYSGDDGISGDGYGSPEEDPELKFFEIYDHPIKEEPEPELCGSDGDAGDVNGYCDYGSLKEEPKPELATTDGRDGNIDVDAATSDDTVANAGRDVVDDCSYCGVNLRTQEFKVEHELSCKVQIERRELESRVTEAYHCGYCKCPFVSEEYKEQHQQKYCRKRPFAKRRDSNGSYFKCDKCQYVAKWKGNLERHLLNHNKNSAEWFTCTQCQYKTVHKRYMTNHMKNHGNNFSCCCPICRKSFRSKQAVEDHLLKQHSDEPDEVSKLIMSKIYTCNICDKFRTTRKTGFNEHVTVTHNKGVGCQKYQCPRCPYSTFRERVLKRHSRTHEEQKDYRCIACKKQFARKDIFYSHILSYHADNVDLMKTVTSKIHRCESCSYKTVTITKLKRHVRSKHI